MVQESNPGGGGEIFRACPTVPGAHPDFLHNGYRIYFTKVKRPGRGGDHSSQSSAEVKEIVQQYLYLPPGTSWPVLGCHSKHMVPYIYRVSQEERTKLREGVPYVKLYRYNPKHLCPKLNGFRDNGK